MKMNEGCKGCCHYFFYIGECRYTPRGMKVILDCICQECLIKPVCASLCDDFRDGWGDRIMDELKNYKSITYGLL